MMTNVNYWDRLSTLEAQLNANGLHWDRETTDRFNIISAHIKHFMPQLGPKGQLDFYNSFMLQNWMNAMDLKFFNGPHPWPIHGWELFLNRIKIKKGIICTYHYGAYQLITYLLNRDKVPFALLVADKIFNTWNTRNMELKDVLEEAAAEDRFVLINASDRTGLKSMYSLADNGFHLLVYMDGLEGIANNDSLASITFMNQPIEVPKGIASLAHKLELPLYPMMALREKGAIRIDSLPTIEPEMHRDRLLFAEETMRKLYAWLECYVAQSPDQWTMWAHLSVIRADLKNYT